jgi:hypothetical protein
VETSKGGGPIAYQPVSAETISPDGERPRQWAETLARLEPTSTYWLSTVRPEGGPHVVPVLAVWVDGALHFAASDITRKAKNLAADRRCVVAVPGDGLDLVVEGEAVKERDEAILRRVADNYASNYEWQVNVRDGAFHDAEGAPTAGPPPYEIYRVVPTMAFGFGTTEPARSTRWRF